MKDFTSGNAGRQIVLFSLPMLIGNLFQHLYSMADAVVVGRYVNGTALAAVGMGINISNFLLAALIGLATGASVVISQFYGARQHGRIERTVSTSIVFFAGFSVIVSIIGIVGSPFLLRWLNTPQAILADATIYLRVLMGGMIFTVFFNMYTAYLRALGDSRSPLYILVFCTLFNVALDLLFVIYFEMGVLGVAVATVIAQAISAILCFVYVGRNVPLLKVTRMAFEWDLFRAILKYGSPAALQLSLVSLANLTITRLINSFGAATMAGITAATKIDQLAIMPVGNVSMALSTFVAQNMGAGQEARAKKGFRLSLLFMVALAVGISGLLIVFGPQLVSLFLNQDDVYREDILRVGLEYLNIIVAFYFLFAFLFAFNGFFRGVGDAVIAMVFPVGSLTIRTVSAYLLADFAGMGSNSLAWSIPVGWGMCSLASWFYYRKRLWVGKLVIRTAK